MDVESLMNIKVVTASKFAQPIADAPGVITVVSQDEIQRFGGITLAEVLNRVPGLQLTTAYFTDRSVIAARGDQTKINGGHVLFLINGRPSREVLEGGLVSDILESFPINVLDRIEVVKGPGSVLYGSNAFSAVVNLITKKTDRNSFALAALPGAGGTVASSGAGTLSCGTFSLVGGAQLHQRPDWTTTYRFSNPIPNDPLASTATVQNVTIRDRSRGAYVGLNYGNLSFMSSFTDWQTPSFVRGTVSDNEWKRGFADLGYTIHATRTWTMSADLTYTRNTFDSPDYPYIKRDSHELLAEWTSVVTPTARDRITFGALVNHTEGSEVYYGAPTPIPISNGDRAGTGAYAQLDHDLTASLIVIAGVQVNKLPDVASIDAVPRAGVVWTPVRRIRIKGLYGEAFRAPSINETTLDHPGLAGTPNLLPEKVGTFDFEIGYTGERVDTSFNYFHSRLRDSIGVDTAPARWRYVNLGVTTFEGVEIESKYYLTRSLFVTGSLTYQTTDDDGVVAMVTPVPSTGVKAGVSYQNRRVTASVFDVFNGSIPQYGPTINPAPAAYHMVDAELRLELAPYLRGMSDKGIAFVLHANDLANRQVWLPDWGGNTGDTIPTYRGRTVYAGVELSLNGAHANGRIARNGAVSH